MPDIALLPMVSATYDAHMLPSGPANPAACTQSSWALVLAVYVPTFFKEPEDLQRDISLTSAAAIMLSDRLP